jgi:TonB-linked SusC/RagA family outer membrane protein
MEKNNLFRELFYRSLKKTLLIMRIAIFLLILGILQAYAVDTYSQKTRLSLNFSDTELIKVLDNIEEESEFFFLYNEKLLDTDRRVNITANDQFINVILDNLFADTDVKYTIIDRKIILAPDYLTKESDAAAIMQQQIVTGEVTDSQTGEAMPGVNIIVKDTNIGVLSDANGRYSITVPGQDAVLVFSFIGYVSQEIPIAGQKVIDVRLVQTVEALDEVVVIGYGTVKKATVTGAISTVEGVQLQKSPAVNITNSFAGRLPGLLVVTRSGEPGNDESILRIRGSNTLGNNNPLIVIDGITNRDMNRISPSDIESITVLKDASAAIYGAQAANGVILITTKRGLEGKPKITLNLNQGWSMPTVLPEMADAATYAQMINEINYYDGNPAKYSSEEIQKFKDGSDPWKYPNTDWYGETMKPASSQNYANLEIRGGSQAVKYFVSIGANYQDGIYKNSATNYQQANFRSNIDGQITKNIKLSIDIAGRQETRNYPTRSAGNIFSMLMRGYPVAHAYWPNGLPGPDIALGNNPVVITTSMTGYDKQKDYIMESVMKLEVTIPWVKGLSLSSNVSFDKNFRNRKLWETPWYLYMWDGITYDENNLPLLSKALRGLPSPQLTQNMVDGSRTTLNALATYETSISELHNIKILVGTERISGESMNFQAFRKYFVSNVVDQLFAGSELEKDNNGSANLNARLNYFGRFNYGYRGKYLMEFVFRYDGSYIFPADKRFGFFPGISLGWIISEEDFWSDYLNFINSFKLRGSWGQTGNDRIETYQYLSSYGFSSSSYVFNSEEKILNELRIPNPNVTWEVANQLDVGFDGSVLDSKLQFQADYFYNLRTNILWYRSASVPQSSGLTLPRENIGEVVNQGFDFQVSYRNKIGNLNYFVSLNSGYQRNRIKFWDETPGIPEYQQSTGRPMNAGLYYQAIGVFKDQAALDAYPHWQGARPGDIIFEDVNKDGEINGLDQVREEKTNLPVFSGGLNIDLNWKNFYGSAFMQWATGAVRNNYYEMQGEAGNFLAADAEGRWTEENPSSTKPRTWNRYYGYWREQSNTYWLRSTDYMRLKNIEIGYNIAALRSVRELGIEDLRVYFTGLNLITFDKLKDFDPESTSSTSYPLNKVFNIGVSLTF